VIGCAQRVQRFGQLLNRLLLRQVTGLEPNKRRIVSRALRFKYETERLHWGQVFRLDLDPDSVTFPADGLEEERVLAPSPENEAAPKLLRATPHPKTLRLPKVVNDQTDGAVVSSPPIKNREDSPGLKRLIQVTRAELAKHVEVHNLRAEDTNLSFEPLNHVCRIQRESFAAHQPDLRVECGLKGWVIRVEAHAAQQRPKASIGTARGILLLNKEDPNGHEYRKAPQDRAAERQAQGLVLAVEGLSQLFLAGSPTSALVRHHPVNQRMRGQELALEKGTQPLREGLRVGALTTARLSLVLLG
jgi:hypothetical protein